MEVERVVAAMLVTHGDDLPWAIEPKYEVHMNKILKAFVVNDDKAKSATFRYYGKTVEQLPDFPIRVTCEPATEGINGINYCSTGGEMDDLATVGEVGQMRSVVGSLGWITRQRRLDRSLRVSQGQGAVNRATLKDLKFVNQARDQAKEFKDEGLYFDSNALIGIQR